MRRRRHRLGAGRPARGLGRRRSCGRPGPLRRTRARVGTRSRSARRGGRRRHEPRRPAGRCDPGRARHPRRPGAHPAVRHGGLGPGALVRHARRLRPPRPGR
ncbi:hypothetical protein ELQ39_02075 [Streptomyces sp. GB4-14]|nr:hypothetical protein [Streptomyces sp. GB4-14]